MRDRTFYGKRRKFIQEAFAEINTIVLECLKKHSYAESLLALQACEDRLLDHCRSDLVSQIEVKREVLESKFLLAGVKKKGVSIEVRILKELMHSGYVNDFSLLFK